MIVKRSTESLCVYYFPGNLLGLDHQDEIDPDPALNGLIIQYKRETLLFMKIVGSATSLRSTGQVQK